MARSGTFTPMRSVSQRWIRAGAPLNKTRFSCVDLNWPNPFPAIVTVAPGGAALGISSVPAQAWFNTPVSGRNPKEKRATIHMSASPGNVRMGSSLSVATNLTHERDEGLNGVRRRAKGREAL